jgi:hypothetical protein
MKTLFLASLCFFMLTVGAPADAQTRGAGVRFVGTPRGSRGVTVTPSSRPPAGYRAAGSQPVNGTTFRNFVQAKAGIGSDRSHGFYTGGYRDFVAGRGVITKR